MSKVDNFRIRLGDKEYVPIMQGGMGVDISTSELALAVCKEGGIGHISDAMAPYVSDRKFGTKLQNSKQKEFKEFANSLDKSAVKWDYERTYEGTFKHVESTMQQKQGSGAIFVNTMEKLTMGNPEETLRARIAAQMDAGVDGITLSAGLHKGSLGLVADQARFHDVKFGIIVSSVRALKIFLRSGSKYNRKPDYIIVEGPLAGGHLGFSPDDWHKYDLKTIVAEVLSFLKDQELDIPVIPAGGVFTGTDAANYLEMGAAAVQVATRFTIAEECGLPAPVKQIYVRAEEEEIEVNLSSPTGYPMRMLKSSPSLSSNIRPNCEALGYLLDRNGNCAYHEAWDNIGLNEKGKKLPVREKMCICYHFMKFNTYTCGHNVYRLKDTTREISPGNFFIPSAAHIFNDYRYSVDHQIALPTSRDIELAENSASLVSNIGKNGNGHSKGVQKTESQKEAGEKVETSSVTA